MTVLPSLLVLLALTVGAGLCRAQTGSPIPDSETPAPAQQPAGSELAFLQARSGSPPRAGRPYSLSLSPDDYHYTPRPRHLRPARLLRVLGPSFDPFWMSVERPAEPDRQRRPPADASPELRQGAARYRRKLEQEAHDLELGWTGAAEPERFRAWLVQMATCRLSHQWVDMGPVFWPRWVRHTDCEEPGATHSCSFPAGMSCKRAQVTQIKILAWHCWGAGGTGGAERVGDVGEPGGTGGTGGSGNSGGSGATGGSGNAGGSGGTGGSGNAGGSGATGGSGNAGGSGGTGGSGNAGGSGRQCVWRQVPYPVVTACKCSCK
ncbi:uncharacterized protein [Lepisosteus oculatus]|uniref:uncharacterized protein n=1 Tax=Lepisosteus oculatus TaxID=7918 RepID=UPI0035F51847